MASPAARQAHIKSIRAILADALSELSNTVLAPNRITDYRKWTKEQDANIADLQTTFQRLHFALLRERNAMIPIVLLPAEILGEIFSYGSYRSRFSFSAVCYAWRMTALASPRLWSYLVIHPRYLRHLPAMEERSAAAPLNLHLSMHLPKHLAVPAYLERIQHICFAMPHFPPEDASSISNLRSLRLTYLEDNRYIANFSSLRHLSLQEADILPDDLPQRLQTLHLQRDYARDVVSTLTLISKFPLLEEISLSNTSRCLPNAVIAHGFRSPPLLRRLRLSGFSFSQMRSLLRALIQNDTIDLIINIRDTHDPADFQLLDGSVLNSSAISIWIDPLQRTIIYKLNSAVYMLRTSFSYDPFDSIPRLTHLHTVQSLYASLNFTRTPIDVTKFTGIVQLVLSCSHTRNSNGPENLEKVVDAELVHSCPHLIYIGLVIQRTDEFSTFIWGTDWLIEDINQFSEALRGFLDLWEVTRGGKFRTLEIHDDKEADRWHVVVPLLSSKVDTLGIGPLSVDMTRPSPSPFQSFGSDYCPECIKSG